MFEREHLVELDCPEGNVHYLPPSRNGSVMRASTGERGCRMCGSWAHDFVDVRVLGDVRMLNCEGVVRVLVLVRVQVHVILRVQVLVLELVLVRVQVLVLGLVLERVHVLVLELVLERVHVLVLELVLERVMMLEVVHREPHLLRSQRPRRVEQRRKLSDEL